MTQIVDQPVPTPNERPSIQSLVRQDLEEREQVGIQRYGTALQAHNGRDALVDAYQEALDLACYVRQAIEEKISETSLVEAYREGMRAGRLEAAREIRERSSRYTGSQYRNFEMCARIAELEK